MRNYLFHIACLLTFLAVPCKGQDRHIDSLKEVLRHSLPDSNYVTVVLDLARAYEAEDRAKSFEYARKGYSLADSLGDKPRKGRALNVLGDLYWYSGDYPAASNYYFTALKLFEEMNYLEGMAECYRNIGWIYQGQGNYDQTIKYYTRSMEIHEKIGREDKLIPNYDDFGIVYKMMGKYDEAIKYGLKAIALSTKLKSERGIATGYGNLGATYFEMKNYQMAIESYLMANEMHKKGDDHYNIAENHIGLAESYLNLDQPDKAIRHAKEAVAIASANDFKVTLANAYYKLARAHALKKEHELSYDYLCRFSHLQDSTFTNKNTRQINEMAAKYESEKKEIMISSLEKDKKLSDEKLERERYFKIYLGIFCLMIAGFALMLFRGNVHKKKANEALSSAYKEIEIKNKDITDSITYSKRIQEATLPSRELKYKLFPDAFVLFRPKDIVSGDFYWYAEKNGKKLIAACDCTGHGVPGALMSMIGNNILHQIVNEKGITSAAAILDHLHLEIRKSLKQQEHAESQDGMDIALVVFDTDREIEFAGAQRPLWIIRRDSREVEEIKGNKFSIGGWQMEENRKFSGHRISLNKDDCIYFFSDGFVDQFGGTDGKKFMTRSFRQLLLSIHREPMAMQELVIDQTLEKWKGRREQIDDVLVIGIRIA